jgi:glycosyltransferase 2 family protein
MEQDQDKVLKTINPNKVIWPIALGLVVAVYMFVRNVDLDTLGDNLAKMDLTWLGAAFLVLFIRDAGYIWRIRYLTNRDLSWSSSTYSILLWEFASAVTPSAVGGTAVATFILNREGISFGRSLAYVMLTAVLDNTFFMVAAPLAILLAQGELFPSDSGNIWGNSVSVLFWVSYTLISVYNVLFAFGLFFRPYGFKWLIVKVTKWRWLRRWHHLAEETGDDVITASAEMRGKKTRFWLNAILSTVFVWTARYALVNCLLQAFMPLDIGQHLLVFARHTVMWVIMLISPTPGSSGTADLAFNFFFEGFVGTSVATVAGSIWRLMTFYPYLFLGAFVLPRWLRKVLARPAQVSKA